MLKNLLHIFKANPALVFKSVIMELIHGVFIAVPTGFLILIVQELFKSAPNQPRLWSYVGIMLVMLFGQLFWSVRTLILSNKMTYSLSGDLRIRLGNQLQHISMGTFKQREPGDLVSVVLQDVANFELIFGHTVGNIATAIFSTLIISVFLLITDWRMALIALMALPSSWVMIRISNYLMVKQGYKHVQARNETGARFLEYILGIRHIKAFGMTGKRFATLDRSMDELRKASIRTEAIPGPFVLTAALVLEMVFLLVVYQGITYYTGHRLSVASLITFLILGYRFYEPLKVVLVDNVILRYMNISLERVLAVLASPVPGTGRQLRPKTHDITFENVTFSYNDHHPVLHNVSFHVPAASMTALVGPSGSGKSTIAALIARFWDVQEGEVKIGGISVKDMETREVYAVISEVFQDVYLFDDTIYNNIRFGRTDATEMEILNAAEKAQVLEFAWELPDGIHSGVGEGGNKLSVGQKQRISIARALLKDAPIILLDEATASLDPENEIYIQQAIQELVRNKTVIVIAHKLATIRYAQQILVLKDGYITEQGTHQELINRKGLYQRLWEIQQSAGGWKVTQEKMLV